MTSRMGADSAEAGHWTFKVESEQCSFASLCNKCNSATANWCTIPDAVPRATSGTPGPGLVRTSTCGSFGPSGLARSTPWQAWRAPS